MVLEQPKEKYKKVVDYKPEFFKHIAETSNIFACINCGTCTSSCVSGRWTALKTRLIVRKASLGDMSVLEDPDIWLCTTCYNCYERCPRDVRPTDVIIELRNLASQQGHMHPSHIAVVGYLRKTGHGVPINDKIIEQRKKLGLAPLPETLYKYKDEENSELPAFAKLFGVVEKGLKVKEDREE